MTFCCSSVSRLCLLGTALLVPAYSQTSRPSAKLEPEHLRDAGLHMASYTPSIEDLMRYQETSSTYQRLMIEWDSLPGWHGYVRKEAVQGVPLSPNFVLLDRKQNLPGAAGKTDSYLAEDDLVIVGATSSGEVRGVRVQPDPRMWHDEYLVPGKRQERHDVVIPKVTVEVLLPDDPSIKSVVFFKPLSMPDGGWRLQKTGELQLPSKPPPQQRGIAPTP
jgi:hypothetical protein